MMSGQNFCPRYVGASWKYALKFMCYNDIFNLAVANRFLASYIGNTAALWRVLSLDHATDIYINFSAMASEMVAGDVDLTVSKIVSFTLECM